MQLVAYGAQDIYLTGNPQITFFKVVYRRHTNFSMETIEQTINGSPEPSATSSVTISRNGDLVHKIYVTSTASGAHGGDRLVDYVEVEIGGQKIDRQYSEWMQVWNELSVSESKCKGLKSMLGCYGTVGLSEKHVNIIQLPLLFWFCRNPGLALPLIALQYHEVKLNIKWGNSGNGVNSSACGVNCDYIYLDTDERRRFAQVSHEYLIEQIQREVMDNSNSHKLLFNHPVKEIIWTTSDNTYKKAKLTLNGHDRLALQPREYYQLRQPYDYHTAVPRQNLQYNSNLSDGYTLSESIFPQPLTVRQITNNQYVQAHFANNEIAAKKVETQGDQVQIMRLYFSSATQSTFSANFKPGDTGVLKIITTGENSIFLDNIPSSSEDSINIISADSITTISEANLLAVDFTFKVMNPEANAEFHKISLPFSTSLENNIITQDGAKNHLNITSIGWMGNSIQVTAGSVDIFKKVLHNGGSRTSNMSDKINVYSFSLKPEEHQPSGTCNFSRIDSAYLEFSVSAPTTVYAVNYNVLRIMSGMGGLAYSN